MARSSEAMSLGAKRCTVGSFTMASRSEIRCAEDSMLRRSWLTLRDGEAERRQPALLLQHRGQLALHVVQFALGHADFVAPPRRRDDARRVLGILAEGHHVAR